MPFVDCGSGRKIYFREFKPTSLLKMAKKVVFLMGVGGTHVDFMAQMSHLGSLHDFHVIGVDNRGAGFSQLHPGEGLPDFRWTVTDFAEDVLKILDFLK
jgi:pimeloyl-ACP methyl ester carboxylesterase